MTWRLENGHKRCFRWTNVNTTNIWSSILLPEDSLTSFILPDLDLTRKSSRSPRPDTASNLVKEQGLIRCSKLINYWLLVTSGPPLSCRSQQDQADELYLRVSPKIFPAVPFYWYSQPSAKNMKGIKYICYLESFHTENTFMHFLCQTQNVICEV